MNYWETETPVIADTGANVFRYFREAGKLQISLPDWKDKNGDKKPGKTVTVDTAALQGCRDVVAILTQIIG